MIIGKAALYLYTIYFSIYSVRKNWFVGLCSLSLLLAFIEHPYMPKTIAGIQGLNLWNVLLIFVFYSWQSQRKWEPFSWDMPRLISFLYFSYMFVIIFSATRMLLWGNIKYLSTTDIFSEFYINNIKWTLVFFMFFDACRTKRRVIQALITILSVHVLISIQVIYAVPIESIKVSGEALNIRSANELNKEVGYHRVSISSVLSGASWGVLLMLIIFKKFYQKSIIFGSFLVLILGQAISGGRAGYISWGFIGFVIGTLRWRKVLLFIPVVVIVVISVLPSVKERMFQGLEEEGTSAWTAGRTSIWPFVLDAIWKSPFIGYGRNGMIVQGIDYKVLIEIGETDWAHPHNGYLEILLDNGIIGLVIVMGFYFVMLRFAYILFFIKHEPILTVVGGYAIVSILSKLVSAIGGSHFYPSEEWVFLWACFGILLRCYIQYQNSIMFGIPLFYDRQIKSE